MSDDPELLAIVERMSASFSAVQELVRQQEERLSKVEGDVLVLKGLAKGTRDRLTAMEALQSGNEAGSFAWALMLLRRGQPVRRAAWGDASRVEGFDWRRWLDGCPDEDLLATDWLRA
jgi:hypothetical protein